MASAKLFFPVSWIDMFNEFDVKFRGILLTNVMNYWQGVVVSDLSEIDSSLSSAWQKMKSMIDAEKLRVEAISAARKIAGSLGGKKRAMNYHKPDGSRRSVSINTKDSVSAEGVQGHLYSHEEETDAERARTASVRVLPAAQREQVFNQRPVQMVKRVLDDGIGFLKAAGSNLCTMMVPVMATSEGFVMPSLFPANFVADTSSASELVSLFDVPEVPSGRGIYPDVGDDDEDDAKKQVKLKKKRVSRKKILDVPPKSEKLVDKTPARRYGEYENVILTDKQYEMLKRELPDCYEEYIRRCDEYCERTQKEYSNYLMTIRNWARKDRVRGVDVNNNSSSSYVSKGNPRFVTRPEDRPFFQSSDIELDARNHEALAEFERMNEQIIEKMRQSRKAESVDDKNHVGHGQLNEGGDNADV